MAANRFEAKKVSVSPNSEGYGGVVRVNTYEDTLANVKGAGWWNNSVTGADLIKQKAIKDFIEKQGLGDSVTNRAVPLHIYSTAATGGGQEFVGLRLDASRNFVVDAGSTVIVT